VIEALLPPGDGLPGAIDAGAGSFLEALHANAAPRLRLGFRLAVFAATWVAPLGVRRLPPLGRLDPKDRERALAKMARSRSYPLRQLAGLLKTVVSLGYGADPVVLSAIRYGRRP
jgi:hypothetical protein